MKRAYSYTRFSTAEQLKGKSLERQTEGAARWCEQNNAKLDTELTLHDLGVSAFRGKNSDTGALGQFLKAIHAGQVPHGSYLLIETFDRMSRESAYDAQLTLQNIINAGITVVTLMDGKNYNVTILRSDPLALIYAILLMSRSHEESATKSKRIADAWRRKRKDLHNGVRLTSVAPGWIRMEKNKPRLIPERAKVVRRIFALFLAGEGRRAITAKLNNDQVPTFGGGAWWTSAYVHLCLRNRAVVGEFQPKRIDHSNPRRRLRVAEGPPIANYWPVLVTLAVFDKVQLRIDEAYGKRPTQSKGLKNILAGIARCPVCGGLMERSAKHGLSPRLVCARARAAAGCVYRGIRSEVVEASLITNAGMLAAEVPDTSAELLRSIAKLETDKKELETLIFDMAMLLNSTPSKTIAAKIQEAEADCERLQAEIDQLQAQLHYGNARRIKDSVARMKSALQWHAQDPGDVAGVNAALRECFEKIIVDYQHTRLEMHWRHGQTTAIPY